MDQQYPGDEQGHGDIFNFVTKRGNCQGVNSKISWTQVETGSAITWKYPSVSLLGDNSIGEFYSVAVTISRIQGSRIHLGIEAPKEIRVIRGEMVRHEVAKFVRTADDLRAES